MIENDSTADIRNGSKRSCAQLHWGPARRDNIERPQPRSV